MSNIRRTDYKKYVLAALWIFQGMLVGFGAILPGISGGTLCVAFGMYRPIIETISDIRSGLRKNGVMLLFFFFGMAIGFVGLSGLAAWLLKKNTVLITCVFIGFVLGTLPALWKDAGLEGRTKRSFSALGIGFVGMMILLTALKSGTSFTVSADISGYLLCGVLWGLSFVVPGLSSSSLLLFFGLYQPMLEGIASFDFYVLIPLAIGMLACVLVLTKFIQAAYKNHFSFISHGIIGIVIATTVMIIPPIERDFVSIAINLIAVVAGIVISILLGKFCDRLKKSQEE